VIKLMNWADVEKALVHVKNALGVDDANLLRAALVLREHGVTMTEYQRTFPASESAGRDKSDQDGSGRLSGLVREVAGGGIAGAGTEWGVVDITY